MKNLTTGLCALSLMTFMNCSDQSANVITVSNPSDLARKEVLKIDLSNYAIASDKVVISVDGKAVPVEAYDKDGDGVADKALVLVNAPSKGSTSLEVSSGTPGEATKMTQAEISVKEGGEWQDRKYIGGEFVNQSVVEVPEDHTDHSYWIRYEGPGWESDLVGYRFYLDWRNGVDIFGKSKPDMALQGVGLDGFDSYHEPAEWGLDILKVGGSLGMGSIGRFLEDSLYRFQEVENLKCEISRNGLLKSAITTTYDNWVTEEDTTSLISEISIKAASRITKHSISFDRQITGFCTGIVRNKGEEYLQLELGDYMLLATYGKFSLNNDQLGMAVIVSKEDVEKVIEADHSHVVVFNPADEVTYRFLAAWEGESNGIKDFESFKTYLNQELEKLNSPLTVIAK